LFGKDDGKPKGYQCAGAVKKGSGVEKCEDIPVP